MRYIHTVIGGYQGPNIKVAKSAESAKLGPRTTAESQHEIKAGRLKGQLFACRSGVPLGYRPNADLFRHCH